MRSGFPGTLLFTLPMETAEKPGRPAALSRPIMLPFAWSGTSVCSNPFNIVILYDPSAEMYSCDSTDGSLSFFSSLTALPASAA